MEAYFWWTDEQKKLAVEVKEFVDELMPRAEEASRKQEFPWDIVESIASRGYFGAGVAKEYGGTGLGVTGACIVNEEVGRMPALDPGIFSATMLGGVHQVTEFGIFGEIGSEYVPAGFNAWRECDGEPTIGEVIEMDTFHIEGTDKVMRGVDAPPGFWEYEDLKQQEERIKKNMRAILQLFDIKVIVFPEGVEIKGAIPTQVLEKSINKEETATAPINSSPSPILERGRIF